MEHKLITGGEQWLPFARACVRKLKGLGLPYADQSFEVSDASIRIYIRPEHEYIRITGGTGAYEFFTSDKWFVAPYFGTLGVSDEGNQSIQYGCGTRTVRGSPKALFSNTLDGGDAWPLVSYTELKNSQARAKTGMLWLKHAANNQRLNPHVWWQDNDPHKIVTSTNTWGRGRTWNSSRYRPYNFSQIMFNYITYSAWFFPFVYLRPSAVVTPAVIEGKLVTPAVFTRDYQKGVTPLALHEGSDFFDVVPTLYSTTGMYTAGHKRTTQANWRHAAVVRASDGTEFCVSTDTHGVFTFYKLITYPFPDSMWGAIPDPYDLPDEMVSIVRVEYPTWVTVTPDSESTTDDHWLWCFNKDGTKAATTPINKQPATVYIRHWSEIVADGRTVWHIESSPVNDYPSSATWVKVPVYELTDPTTPDSPLLAVMLLSTLIPFSHGFGLSYFEDEGIASIALPAPAFYTPMHELTPGFVEVTINIERSGDTFTPTVAVTSSEKYADNGIFYVDTDYYIRTPRTTPGAAWRGAGHAEFEPAEDELLTAELEVKYVSDNYLDTLPTDYYACLAGIGIANLHIEGLFVNLVVRRRSDRAVVKRLCLANNVEFDSGAINYTDYAPTAEDPGSPPGEFRCTYHQTMVGVIDQIDLRYLSFLTASYCRRKTVLRAASDVPVGYSDINGFQSAASRVSLATSYLKPRYELRVHGEPLKTIDYSEPHLTGFSAAVDASTETYGNDPMSSHTTTGTAADFSTDSVRKNIPLYLKQYFAGVCLFPTHINFMALSPDGSCAVYADRRGMPAITPESESFNGSMTVQPTSTESSGVFDIIAPYKGKRTSHKTVFNASFKQARDYGYYENAASPNADFGGFATHGVWY